MQNDLFWYKEKDEDYAMPPFFGGGDFYGDPSEDKYVMTVQTGEHIEDQVAFNFISDESIKNLERRCTRENLKDEAYKDYYELGEHFRLEQSDEKEHCTIYSCSAPLCACCSGAGKVYAGNPVEYDLGNLKATDANDNQLRTIGERLTASDTNFSTKGNSTYDWVRGFVNTHDFHTVKKDNQPNNNDNYDFIYDEVIAGEIHEPEVAVNEESGTISDELHMYTKEDDYEIFNLRIIHRKNRFVSHLSHFVFLPSYFMLDMK